MIKQLGLIDASGISPGPEWQLYLAPKWLALESYHSTECADGRPVFEDPWFHCRLFVTSWSGIDIQQIFSHTLALTHQALTVGTDWHETCTLQSDRWIARPR